MMVSRQDPLARPFQRAAQNRMTGVSGPRRDIVLESIVTEYVSCDLCGSDDHELLYSRFDPITRQEYNLVECRCGMAFVNPMPTPGSIPSLYPTDYLKDKQDMTPLYSRMMEFMPPLKNGKLLDIGCGRGDFIHHASKSGWHAEGVDLIDWNSPHKVPMRVGDFLTMSFSEQNYDVVTAWAVMEHVGKPSLYFKRASELLKRGGSFIFVVPNFDAPGMRRACTEDIPRHLHLFTPEAVNRYLTRFGMEAEAVFHTDRLYSSYPFGLVRYAFRRLRAKETRCSRYENRSVALLRNRQIKGNARAWLSEVVRTVSPFNIAIDALDLCVGIIVAKTSKIIGNYGVMVVVARRGR
jgi:2-polyprenyl-3-methyl-5-hydroxy-6-metoxy-1,4-benzoquinol methylase